jgi:hypothetical protein
LEYEGAEAGGGEVREYAAEKADDFDYNGQSSYAAFDRSDLVGSGSREGWSWNIQIPPMAKGRLIHMLVLTIL